MKIRTREGAKKFRPAVQYISSDVLPLPIGLVPGSSGQDIEQEIQSGDLIEDAVRFIYRKIPRFSREHASSIFLHPRRKVV